MPAVTAARRDVGWLTASVVCAAALIGWGWLAPAGCRPDQPAVTVQRLQVDDDTRLSYHPDSGLCWLGVAAGGVGIDPTGQTCIRAGLAGR